MQLQSIINGWNAQSDEYNQWPSLDSEEKVEWAIKFIQAETESSLADLEKAVYAPGKSCMSVKHACDHVRQCLSA